LVDLGWYYLLNCECDTLKLPWWKLVLYCFNKAKHNQINKKGTHTCEKETRKHIVNVLCNAHNWAIKQHTPGTTLHVQGFCGTRHWRYSHFYISKLSIAKISSSSSSLANIRQQSCLPSNFLHSIDFEWLARDME